MELLVRSKNLRQILLALVIVVLSPVAILEGISIYDYSEFLAKPSASEQILAFVGLPQDTQLPRTDVQEATAYSNDALNTDYHPIVVFLTGRFPLGTSRHEIESFVAGQSCDGGAHQILCTFKNPWYPSTSLTFFSPWGLLAGCDDSVYLTFTFDPSDRLDGIEVFGATNCL